MPPSPTLRHSRKARGDNHFTSEVFTSDGEASVTGFDGTRPRWAAMPYSSFNAACSFAHVPPSTGAGFAAPRRRQSSQSSTSSSDASSQSSPRCHRNVKNSR